MEDIERLVRLREAGRQLGYRPSYAARKLPHLLPIFRLGGETSPRFVRQSDIDRLIESARKEPVVEGRN